MSHLYPIMISHLTTEPVYPNVSVFKFIRSCVVLIFENERGFMDSRMGLQRRAISLESIIVVFFYFFIYIYVMA